MQRYRSTGNLAIRPCEICSVLVLHEESVPIVLVSLPNAPAPRSLWRAFPHQAPGGASCIGGGAAARALRRSGSAQRWQQPTADYEPA